MKIIFSARCLEYGESHIESPSRVQKAYEILNTKGYEFVEPLPASKTDLLEVHSEEYVEMIRLIKGGDFLDPDTPGYENIYEYARLSAGGAILAAKENGFSFMRPPGHHAGKGGTALGAPTLGFCYFNNIAVAVRFLDKPTLIIDIDGHHGNGTQEIFLGDPDTQFISLHKGHRFGYFYPGTGLESEQNCLNHTFFEPPGDELYIKTLEKILRQINMDDIETIAISAGFDAHKRDLASLGLSSNCYRKIGEMIGSLERPIFAVLEGGYDGDNIAIDSHEFIQGIENSH